MYMSIGEYCGPITKREPLSVSIGTDVSGLNAPSVMVSNPIWRKALAVIATVLDSDEGGVGDE